MAGFLACSPLFYWQLTMDNCLLMAAFPANQLKVESYSHLNFQLSTFNWLTSGNKICRGFRTYSYGYSSGLSPDSLLLTVSGSKYGYTIIRPQR